MQSELATAFYRTIQSWLNEGMPPNGTFSRSDGLCLNAYWWARHSGYATGELKLELHNSFAQAGLKQLYPFNENSDGYLYEHGMETIYLNPVRLQWIKDHAQ